MPLSPSVGSLVHQLLQRSYESVDEAAAAVCQVLRAALAVDVAYASRIGGREQHVLAVDEGLPTGLAPGLALPLAETYCGWALDGRGSRAVSDLHAAPCAGLQAPEELSWAGSYATAPLRNASGTLTGSLCVLDRGARSLNDDELVLLDLLGGILAREQELDGARAREAARDPETEAAGRRYRALVDDLGDMIVEIDAGGRITYANRACTEFAGLSFAEMAGHDMMHNVHPEDRELAGEHMAAALSGADTADEAAAREVRFVAADGSLRWMNVRGRAVFDDAGEFAGFLGILHDVTGRVHAEQQIRAALVEAEAARDEAQRASRAKSEFLSRMSHELRTPLNAILGFGQLLELGDLEGEDADNVAHILSAGRHLLDLINEVLDVVRVESGALGLSLEPVGLGEVLTESLDLVRTAADARGIELRAPDRLDGSMVVADRQRLKQILVNLLSNAVKYNRDGGAVVVSWARSETPVDGRERPEHGWLRLAVSDTGRGIPVDRFEDVFTPFERLGAEGSGIEGTGVGLSLTRTLVEALGGRIGLTSEVGEGSTFWVELPAAGGAPAAPPSEPTPEVELARTVLYIEDNPSNITLVRKVLARRPHLRLTVVRDGAEAVEAAQCLVPDLVLLDLHLPGMHGQEILTALRAAEDARLSKVPIVVVTADLTAGTERRMQEAGATLFLPKPIDVRRLLDVVDDHLPLP